jgi:thiol-disulfide isomerase/thioredoxin
MSSRILILLAFVGCTGGSTDGSEADVDADDDGDGLTLDQEEELGLDPGVSDTDGDGLLDGEEGAHGADPLLVDTDEDGYTDRDEVFEGHDPADADDRIYIGNWPYVYDKSVIQKNAGTFREIGKIFLRLKMVDQHGETVDLYDFYNADKPIVMDISAEWCPPCNAMSSWIEGGDDYANYGSLWPAGPDAVKRGDVYWITVIGEDVNGAPAYPDVANRWEERYPSKKIPVLADGEYLSADYAGLQWWPYTLLLEPDLTLSEANTAAFGDAQGVLTELARRFPE